MRSATRPPTAEATTAPHSRSTTRAAILARAVDLASVEGLEGLTIGRLAADLRMSKSGLFRHFGSKEELQLATLDAAARRYVELVVVPALEAPPGRERLRALCGRYLDHLQRRAFDGGCFWSACASEFDDRPGAVRNRIREFVGAWLALLAREAEAAGAADPEQLAFELHGVGLSANLRARLLADERACARARAAVDRLLADALAA